MRVDEQVPSAKDRLRKRRINFDLYYYERVGDHYSLRITPFAIILMIAAMIFSLTVLYLDGRKQQSATDVRITPPPITTYPPQNAIIQQAPPNPSLPATDKQRRVTPPAPVVFPSPIRNDNER